MCCGNLDSVGTSMVELLNRIRAVDDVHVVPHASNQRVRAEFTRQPIVAVISGDLVVAVIAGAGDVIVTLQHQIFELDCQGVADRSVDFIGAFAGKLDQRPG